VVISPHPSLVAGKSKYGSCTVLPSTVTMSSLNVMVMEASGLDVRASSGVYATVTLGDQTLKTSTVRGEDPVWNDTVIFAGTSMSATYASKLDVKVMGASRSASGADMCLGCITVPVNRIAIGREVEVWFSLRSPDEPEGPVVGEGSASRGKLLLSFVLDGPMRKEVQAAIGLWGTYTTAIDSLLSHTTGLSDAIMPVVTNRAVVAAAIPATAVAAVAIIPALLIAAPVVLPALLFGGALLGLLAILAGFVLAGSRTGRDKVASTLGPIRRKLKETAVGQQLVYETGPRPSINAVMKGMLLASATLSFSPCSVMPLLCSLCARGYVVKACSFHCY
jgi:hypothetical protein